MDYTTFIIPITTGVIVAIVTQSIAHYYSKKSIEAQRENSLQITRMQLYHEEKKEAVIKLDELLKKPYKTFYEFRRAVNDFLDGALGLFLDKQLREILRKEMDDIQLFLSIKEVELYGEPEAPDYDAEDWIDDRSPEQVVDDEVKERLSSLKQNMREKLKEHISP